MLSRGRIANHAWIQVSDVDQHTTPAAQPLLQPFTATQLLEAVFARDEAPVSVTTMREQADDPVRLLGPAVACYLDALSFAADRIVDRATKHAIDDDGQVLHLTEGDAWPRLRSHLIQIAANGQNPSKALGQAYGDDNSLRTARDPAAVLDHRLDLSRNASRTQGPLPWLPGIPSQILDHPAWGPYLQSRYALTKELAAETRDAVTEPTPRWAHDLPTLDQGLVDDIQLWRAAHTIPDTDLRPTGPIQWATAEHEAQQDLDERLQIAEASIRDWTPRIINVVPNLAGDPRLPALATKLATLDHHDYDADFILQSAAQKGPLPDDHPADALRYRITHIAKHMTPASWETYDVSPKIADHLAHPERYELPHSPTPSDRSPGIGF